MISDHVINICQSGPSVTEEIAKNPNDSPTEIIKRLFQHHKAASQLNAPFASTADLDRARQCGNWGPTEPSELFLRVFHDVLSCLDADPFGSVVSPSLIGSYGVVPLTIIAPLADVFRHLANLIVRAEKEVFFITCSWSPSIASKLISDALTELSVRAGRRGERVAVRIMYDKGGPVHVLNNRQKVKPEEYYGKAVQLPRPESIPHIDLQVISYHKPLLGTLHAKFMVVDRKIATVQSPNTEDNTNMEMMTQVEGPIVDSIYDTALITWGNAYSPLSTSFSLPASAVNFDLEEQQKEPLSKIRGHAEGKEESALGPQAARLPELMPGEPHYDTDLAGEIIRVNLAYSSKYNESRLQAMNRRFNLSCPKAFGPTASEISDHTKFIPYLPAVTKSPFPVALVSRPPFGNPNNSNTYVPQNEAFLACIRQAKESIFIQTPDLNATPLHAAFLDALGRGVEVTYYVCLGYNDAGEIMPGQGGTNEMFAGNLVDALSDADRKLLHICYYVAKDQDHPIHHSFKARSCHIKLLIVDGQIGIQGSGNQDTQSWCHSQEINVMIDSKEICRQWREGIERNQNTEEYGKAGIDDGVWRDKNGKEARGSMGKPGKSMGWIKGSIGLAKKIQDKGGF